MSGSLPLEGIRVVDFTWVGAGSFTTKFFADFGAEVIKIESTTRPDSLRKAEPLVGEKSLNESGYFSNRNTNKKGITLNMKTEEAKKIVKKLVKDSDIVANSFTPRTMDKWGLGYNDLKEINPEIIFLSMPMQGKSGPHKDFLGYGITINALMGLIHINGKPGRTPIGMGTNYPDHAPNPCHAAFAVLSALEYRRQTGKGQNIELSQVESSICIFPEQILEYANNGRVMESRMNDHPTKIPYGVYPCKGEDKWCSISVSTEEEWEGLCNVISSLKQNSLFDSHSKRLKHKEKLDATISEWTANYEAEEVFEILQKANVPTGVVQNGEDLLTKDPQLKYRRFWPWLEHPVMGSSVYHGIPFKYKNISTQYRSPAPMIGQNNEELKDWLGIKGEEYNDLIERGIIK
jgi:benzylsuccinate CoA-transferase BbsF subunit